MRDRMERLVVLPFYVGCVTEASIAVSVQQPRRSKFDTVSSAIRTREEEEESLTSENMKSSSFRMQALQKPNISTGFRRLVKGFKNVSQLFVDKEEMEELDMEIGLPTDVKHVTHIGVDGSATTDPTKGWDNLMAPELLSLPSVSLRHFELAMAAQIGTPRINCSS